MTLSKRAERFLATFERRAAPSTDALRTRLRQLELPELEPWLTFQARFAGYVLGSPDNEIVLGCLHEKSVWLPESGIDFEQEADDWFIACADAHPSYDSVATLASAHFAATLQNFVHLEYAWGEVPFRAALLDPTERIVDGQLELPLGPGFGAQLHAATVAEHGFDPLAG